MKKYKKQNWSLTHPYGKNKIWRTIRWAWQRAWYGWDETMPDNFESWMYSFMQVACEESAREKIAFGWNHEDNVQETPEWHEHNMAHGKELFHRAQMAYWNDDEGLGFEAIPRGEDWAKNYMEREKQKEQMKQKAMDWLAKNFTYFEFF